MKELDEIFKEVSEQEGVGKESAIRLAVLGFEAFLRSGGNEEAMTEFMLAKIFESYRSREQWILDLAWDQFQTKLADRTETHRKAVKSGQDPATVFSVTEGLSMRGAQDIVVSLELYLKGASREEITEAQLERTKDRTLDEVREDFAYLQNSL